MGESFIVAAPRLEEFFEAYGSCAVHLPDDVVRMLAILTHGLPEPELAKVRDERLRNLNGHWRDEPWVIAGGYEPASNYREFFSGPNGENIFEEAHYRESALDPYSWTDIEYGLIALWTEIDPTYPARLMEVSTGLAVSRFVRVHCVALRNSRVVEMAREGIWQGLDRKVRKASQLPTRETLQP